MGNKYGRNMGFFMIFLEKYGRYGRNNRKNWWRCNFNVICIYFLENFCRFCFVLSHFFLNEKKIEMDSVDE